MRSSLAVWGIVLLLGFYLSHSLGYQHSQWLWIGWAVVLAMGSNLAWKNAKLSNAAKKIRMEAGIFGFLVTLLIATGIADIGFAFAMTMWILLIGAANFACGLGQRNSLEIFNGLVMAFSSVFVLAFGNSYFLAGAMILGLLTIMQGIFGDRN